MTREEKISILKQLWRQLADDENDKLHEVQWLAILEFTVCIGSTLAWYKAKEWKDMVTIMTKGVMYWVITSLTYNFNDAHPDKDSMINRAYYHWLSLAMDIWLEDKEVMENLLGAVKENESTST